LALESLGLAFMTSNFPSATANVPDDEPSINSIDGGSKLLKASVSFDGRWSRTQVEWETRNMFYVDIDGEGRKPLEEM
jgi:hypothetical protein